MAIRIQWISGDISTADTWSDLLQNMGQVQNPPISGQEMKSILATRTRRWGSVIASPDLPNEQFFGLMEQAGMVTIIEGNER